MSSAAIPSRDAARILRRDTMILKQTGTRTGRGGSRVPCNLRSGLRPGRQDRLFRRAERAGLVHRARHQARRRDGDRRDQRQGRGQGPQARAGLARRRAQPGPHGSAISRARGARARGGDAGGDEQRLDARGDADRQRNPEGAGYLSGDRRNRDHRERRSQGRAGQLPVPHRHVRHGPGQLHHRHHGQEVRPH